MAFRIVYGIAAILPAILQITLLRFLLLSMAPKSRRDFAVIITWRTVVKSRKQNRGLPVPQKKKFFWVTGVPWFCLCNCTVIHQAIIVAKLRHDLGAIESNGDDKGDLESRAELRRFRLRSGTPWGEWSLSFLLFLLLFSHRHGVWRPVSVAELQQRKIGLLLCQIGLLYVAEMCKPQEGIEKDSNPLVGKQLTYM